MLDKIKKTIRRFNMINTGETIIVCISGGVDSVVLLYILMELAGEYKFSIIACHLNHCLRGKESDRDEVYVKGLAKKLGIKIVCKKINVLSFYKKGDSLQDIARNVRYVFFEDVVKRYQADKIATGHNEDDQAETVITRFIRGAGLNGLSGIPPVRDKYIRPLIDVSRKEIEEYAVNKGLRFVQDSSNNNTKYLRNRIRLELIPALEEYNPAIKNDMARLSCILARDENYIKEAAMDEYKDVVLKQEKNAISLCVKKLSALHDAIKVRIFFMVLDKILGSSKGFYSTHIEDFMGILSSSAPNLCIDLPHNLTLYKEYDIVRIEQGEKGQEGTGRKKKEDSFFEKKLKINGKTDIIASSGIHIAEFRSEIINRKSKILFNKGRGKNDGIAYFDYDKLKLPLISRNVKPGDRFVPFGMKGHKKVKELFQEKKIAKRRRGLTPIIVSGNEIIWVAGIRQAEYGRIASDTKTVLSIEIEMC